MTNFEKAVELDNEKWLESLPDEVPEYEFTEQYNKFRIKLFDKMRGDKYHRFTKRATIAIIVAAVLLSMTIVTLAATLGKDFILKYFDGFARIEVSDVESADYVSDFYLGYIPDGYVKTDEDVSKMGILYSYSKEDSWFNISKSRLSADVQLDNENNNIISFEKNGIKYIITKDGESIGILWNDGNFLYELNGNLEETELLRIAYNSN